MAVAQEGQGVDGAIRGGELLGDRLGTDRSWLGCLGDGEFKDWNPPPVVLQLLELVSYT